MSQRPASEGSTLTRNGPLARSWSSAATARAISERPRRTPWASIAWTASLKVSSAWTGVALPLTLSRHAVFTLEGPTPYARGLPVLKDLASPDLFRSIVWDNGTKLLRLKA